ncbi:MAG: hypothetical protein MJY95_00840 [Bacteroidaceae bacterium]|nr:hypothetical protein [Bacteroidaceae bacterium]
MGKGQFLALTLVLFSTILLSSCSKTESEIDAEAPVRSESAYSDSTNTDDGLTVTIDTVWEEPVVINF